MTIHITPSLAESSAKITFTSSLPSGEVRILSYESPKRLMVGTGATPSPAGLYKLAKTVSAKQSAHLEAVMGMVIEGGSCDEPQHIEAIINGLLVGANATSLYKTSEVKRHPFNSPDATLTLVAEPSSALRQAADRALAISRAQLNAMTLINTPSNRKSAISVAEYAVESGKSHGFGVEVFDEKRLEKEGFHALLAVNRGSENPPRFLILTYEGTDPTRHIGLVGKGVTYDSGGLSIKPTDSMQHMRSDMSGAATVLAAFEAVAALKLPVKLTGAIPLTDNMVDGKSYKPGDVIGSYSGKTIEVIDTDAEGRIILADALTYIARHHKPDVIVDLATLTGAAVRAIGSAASALFSNDDALAAALTASGEATGERLWRLPLWDEYKDDIASDIADVKNLGKITAGAISAAKFLEIFIEGHPSWAHLDIAGTAYGDNEFGKAKSATGYGVRLLVDFVSPS
jgi:leucyl aminopeptidase